MIWMSGRYLFILILSAMEKDRDFYLLQLKIRAEDSKERGIEK